MVVVFVFLVIPQPAECSAENPPKYPSDFESKPNVDRDLDQPIRFFREAAPSPETRFATHGLHVKVEAPPEIQLEFENEPRQRAYIYLDRDKLTDLDGIKYKYPVEGPLREDDAEWVERMHNALKNERNWIRGVLNDLWQDAKNLAFQLSLARVELRRERAKMQTTMDKLSQAVGPERTRRIIDKIDSSMKELVELERAKDGAVPQEEDVQGPSEQQEQVQEVEEEDEVDQESHL